MVRNNNFLLRSVGSDYFLVPTGHQAIKTKGIIRLNDTGSFLWNKLDKDVTVEELAKSLAEYFNLSIDDALFDVKGFIKAIKALDLIEP